MKKLSILTMLFTAVFAFSQNERPNVLWLVCEDISPDLSFYGDKTAKTPNLDALASQSTVYEYAFANTPVCAPSRSGIITGMLPTSIGTMHMRTGNDVMSWGKRAYEAQVTKGTEGSKQAFDLTGKPIKQYSAVIPDFVKCYTEYLRAAGYYCVNNQKTDYQFAAPQSAWDENNNKAHWRNTPKGMPFFSIFNFGDTHESKIWLNKDLPLTVDPRTVPLPPYFPDTNEVRRDVARHYSNIELMDKEVGKIIKQLKEDGLYDSTIIFFYSDHGGPLPHEKREIYTEGMRVPFLVKMPNQKNQKRESRMISLVDLGPTMMSITGIKPPKYMEGQAFTGKYSAPERKVVYGTSDRFDEFTDRIRMVRDKKFLYLKNYHPELELYKDVEYRKQMPMMTSILELKKNNKLNQYQNRWFETKPVEELYDIENDPYQKNNLAKDTKFLSKLKELRQLCADQFEKKKDFGAIPESQLIEEMWPKGIQPTTETAKISQVKNVFTLSSSTKGASLSYIFLEDGKTRDRDPFAGWKLYSKPLEITNKGVLITKASRIGYMESKEILQKINY